MDWKDVAGKIASNAPQLGAMLGSVAPGVGNVVGGTIGLGIKALAGAFGLSPEASPDEISAAIQADPNASLKLQVAEMDYHVKMKELENDQLRISNETYELENKRIKDENNNYRKELDTRTVPWVDALHKMGSQITNWSIIVIWGFAVWQDHTFTQYDILLLGGGNLAYQLIKGTGKPTVTK
jgi:hypothetical protein